MLVVYIIVTAIIGVVGFAAVLQLQDYLEYRTLLQEFWCIVIMGFAAVIYVSSVVLFIVLTIKAI
jgi:hypothetical protein